MKHGAIDDHIQFVIADATLTVKYISVEYISHNHH